MSIGLARVYGYSISRVPTTLCSTRAFQDKCSKTGYPVRRKQLAGPSRGLERAVKRHRRREAIRCRMSPYRPGSRTATLPKRSPAVVDRFVLSTRVRRRKPTNRGLSSALDRAHASVQLQQGWEPSPSFGVPISPGALARCCSAKKGTDDVRQGALARTKGINRTAGRNHAPFSPRHNCLSCRRRRNFGRW